MYVQVSLRPWLMLECKPRMFPFVKGCIMAEHPDGCCKALCVRNGLEMR